MQSLWVDGITNSTVVSTPVIRITIACVEHRIDPNALARHPHDIDLLRQAPEVIGVVMHQPIKVTH